MQRSLHGLLAHLLLLSLFDFGPPLPSFRMVPFKVSQVTSLQCSDIPMGFLSLRVEVDVITKSLHVIRLLSPPASHPRSPAHSFSALPGHVSPASASCSRQITLLSMICWAYSFKFSRFCLKLLESFPTLLFKIELFYFYTLLIHLFCFCLTRIYHYHFFWIFDLFYSL